MKTLVVILLVGLVINQIDADFKLYDKSFNGFSLKEFENAVTERANKKVVQFLEKVKQILKNGNETLGIPVLDPYEIEHVESTFNFSDGSIKGFGHLNNLSFTGLSEFNIEEAEFSIIKRRLSVTLKWPLLQEKSLYIVNVFLTQLQKPFQLFGAGELHQNFEDLRLGTIANFGLRSGKVFIKTLDTKISFQKYKFYITGLFHNDEISNTASVFFTEFVKQIVEENHQELVDTIHDLIIPIINDYLSNMSLKDLMNILN